MNKQSRSDEVGLAIRMHWSMRYSTRCLRVLLAIALTGLGADVARAQEGALAQAHSTVQSMAGCFLVDYNYVETESLRPGYVRDPRIYDVNRDKSAKEWITVEIMTPRRVVAPAYSVSH
jgi:hypothetical protein